jgi:hypothetical protein
LDHLNESLAAINVQMTPTDRRKMDAAFAGVRVSGARLHELQLQIADETVLQTAPM